MFCVAGGLPADAGTQQFARELFQRVPRQQADRSYQKQERSAAEFARRNEQYTLLEPTQEELDVSLKIEFCTFSKPLYFVASRALH